MNSRNSDKFIITINHAVIGNDIQLNMQANEVDSADLHAIKVYVKARIGCEVKHEVGSAIHFIVTSEKNIIGLIKSLQDKEMISAIYKQLTSFKVSNMMNDILGHDFGLIDNQGRSLGSEFNNKRVRPEMFEIFNQLKAAKTAENATAAEYKKMGDIINTVLTAKLTPSMFDKVFGASLSQSTKDLYQRLLQSTELLVNPPREVSLEQLKENMSVEVK